MRKFLVFSMIAICLSLPAHNVQAGILGQLERDFKKTFGSNKSTKRYSGSSQSSAQRAENRRVQTSLNYFGFPVGTPDGALGKRSRQGISSYQAHMGYAVTGQLTEVEKTFLLSSYDRAIAGGYATQQAAAILPDGNRGLLKKYRAEQQAASAAPAGNGQMPSIFGAPKEISVANHCARVNLKSSTNGGFATLSNMPDPKQALDEQFCLARVFAMAKSDEMIQNIQGMSVEQLKAQCQRLVPAFNAQVAALSVSPVEDVIRETGKVIVSTGQAPRQMAFMGEVCLGIGYSTDNTELALASGLMLAALGQMPYGELMGHHLVNGFGTTERQDLASQWYTSAVNAVEGGQPLVFAPNQSDRIDIIHMAADKVGASPSGGGASGGSNTFVMPFE